MPYCRIHKEIDESQVDRSTGVAIHKGARRHTLEGVYLDDTGPVPYPPAMREPDQPRKPDGGRRDD